MLEILYAFICHHIFFIGFRIFSAFFFFISSIQQHIPQYFSVVQSENRYQYRFFLAVIRTIAPMPIVEDESLQHAFWFNQYYNKTSTGFIHIYLPLVNSENAGGGGKWIRTTKISFTMDLSDSLRRSNYGWIIFRFVFTNARINA